MKASPEDLKKQLELALEINRKLARLNTTVNQIRSLHSQIRNLDRELSDNSKDLVAASKDLDKKLSAVEEALINPKIAASEDSVAYAIQLDGKLAALESDVESADAAPTEGARAAYADLDHELDRQLTAWDAIRTHELAAVNDLARREKVQAIVLTAGTATEGRRK